MKKETTQSYCLLDSLFVILEVFEKTLDFIGYIFMIVGTMKLIITINDGTLAGQQFELLSGHLSVGRSEHCSIKFDPLSEKIASKQHAFIEAKPDGYYISDNNSTNGTLVNGENITSARLNSGDSIQFGTEGIMANVFIDAVQTSAVDEESIQTFAQDLPPTQLGSQSNQIQQSPAINIPFTAQPTSVMESVSSIGIKNFDTKPDEESQTGKYIGIAVTFFVVAFLSLIVAGIMFLSLGPLPAIIAAFVAFVPAFIYLFPIIWLDRYDPEPFWLLSLAFAWGALVAVFISFIANTVVGLSVSVIIDPTIGTLTGAVLAAPFFEEITKGAGLLVIVLFFRKYFDGILDGIIFAGVIALGFATVENVLYYGRGLLADGLSGLLVVFFMRGILSPFAHVTFTAMTGIGFGLSRESHNPFIKYVMPFIGLGLAMFLHASWNGVAMLFGGGFLIFYLLIEIPFFLFFVCFAFWIMWRQNRIIRESLAIDVAQGVIPNEHFERATSAFKSTGWILGSIFTGKYKATSSYIRAIGKLGLSYWHIQRAKAAQGETMSYQQKPILREEVIKWRDQV